MTTIEDLYYGNIHPCDRDVVRGSPVDRLLKLLCKNEETLTATPPVPPLSCARRYAFTRSGICDIL